MIHKKAQGISLQFLMGLIFTGFLIVFAYSIVSKFFFTPPLEMDIVDQWAEDINSASEDRVFQLLPISDLLTDDSLLLFIPKSKSKEELSFQTFEKRTVTSGSVANINSLSSSTYNVLGDLNYLSPSCGNNNCLCSYNLDTKKNYCAKLSNSDITFKGTSEIVFYSAGGKQIVDKSKRSISSVPDSPYIKIVSSVIMICEDKTTC